MTRLPDTSESTMGLDDLFAGAPADSAPEEQPLTKGSATRSLVLALALMVLGAWAFVAGFGSVFTAPDPEMGNPLAESAASVLWAGFVGVLAASSAVAAALFVLGAIWLIRRRATA